MVNNAYNKNGATMVGGSKYSLTVGSRAQVWNGTAYKTGYGKKGLKRSDLIRNKHGRIVSGLKQLHAKGYFTRKGHFGVVKKGSKTAKKGRKKGKSKGKRCRHKSGKKKGKYKKCKTKKRR